MIGQLGTMIYFLLPMTVKAGRTSLLAIPFAGIVSCILAVWTEGRQSKVYTRVRKILALGFGLLVWYRLSCLLAGYLGRETFWPVAGAVLVALLLLGRKGMHNPQGLKSLWGKVLGILLAFLLLFQIPNCNVGYVFAFSGDSMAGVWKEAGMLLLYNVPFWIGLGKGPGTGQRPYWQKQVGLWLVFFLIFTVLAAVYHFPLLVQSETMFLNLGRSAAWLGKAPVRMEIPADIVLWVSVFFTLWECAATLWEAGEVSQKKNSPKEKEGKEAA